MNSIRFCKVVILMLMHMMLLRGFIGQPSYKNKSNSGTFGDFNELIFPVIHFVEASLTCQVRRMIRVREFELPIIEPMPSFLTSQILPGPNLSLLTKVVPTSIVNVYNAEVDSSGPIGVFFHKIKPQPVSLVTMPSCMEAHLLEERMKKIASLTDKDCILGTKVFIDRVKSGSVRPTAPCLVTDVVPQLTVANFLAENPSLPVKKEFFKKLFSVVSKLHQAKVFFGNIGDGLRVLDNKPILTFPAKDVDLCSGIQNDLLHCIALAIQAFSDLTVEMRSFLSICRDVIHFRNFNVLSSGSYWILHHDLVWSPDDCARFVLRLHEYYQYSPVVYQRLVDDGAIRVYPYHAVDYDWKGILNRPLGADDVIHILADDHYKEAIRVGLDGKSVYDHSERLRYWIRCKLSHLPVRFTVERMITSINEVLPEAMTRLYYMAYRRFHFQGWLQHFHKAELKHLMPNFVDFFKHGPGKHNSFQF